MHVFGGGDPRLTALRFLPSQCSDDLHGRYRMAYDWLAGLYAGGLFALRHGSESPWFARRACARDNGLLVASYACLFASSRHSRPTLTGAFGLLAGMAASINLSFILRYGALRPFLFVLRTVTPTYTSLNHPGRWFLIAHMAPAELIALAPLAILALGLHPTWNWERSVLLLGGGFGLLSYFLQQKGFFHHRYAFLPLVFCSSVWSLYLRRGRPDGLASWAASAFWFRLCTAFHSTWGRFELLPVRSCLTLAMEADLRHLGVSRLQRGSNPYTNAAAAKFRRTSCLLGTTSFCPLASS